MDTKARQVKHNENPPVSLVSDMPEAVQDGETHLEYQRRVLKYITEFGSSLRLDMDIDTLLKRVSEATFKALGYRYSVLYLSDGIGYFRARATSGCSAEGDEYLRQHPVPDIVVAKLISEEYRISESYFIPAEAPIWKDSYISSFFVVADEFSEAPTGCGEIQDSPGLYWDPEDMLVVPLISGDNILLGFLTPDAPLDGLRPRDEIMSVLELFANQAAVVIEGAHLYEEARRNVEERAALIEIGRVLSAPDALRDLETVYQTIYEQVKRVMPADAFFVTRYYSSTNTLTMDYLIDEGVRYPGFEYTYFPFNMKKLLYEEKLGYIFSTAEEYTLFVDEQTPEVEEDLFGSMRSSQSLLFAPIHYGEGTIGFLSAHSYEPHAYTRRHLVMLKEISIQAGIAITNARLNSELREALKQAQESEQLKNHFLMTASHELRTPLTAIQGYLELLAAFDEILEPTIAREDRLVLVRIPDELYVWVDDLRLRQILLNLVGNALKYTPVRTKIEITAEDMDVDTLRERLLTVQGHNFETEADQFVVIAIRDWGWGIRAVDQARLFTKFMRLDSALNSTQRGAGLGLYLCRQLTEAMGGYIWVESKGMAGEGSTFVIALPRYAKDDERSGEIGQFNLTS